MRKNIFKKWPVASCKPLASLLGDRRCGSSGEKGGIIWGLGVERMGSGILKVVGRGRNSGILHSIA